MGFIYLIKNNINDIGCKIRAYKWKFIFCVVSSLIGFALGIVLFCTSKYGWWYYNRCDFASKIVNEGFSVLISFIVSCALIYLLFVLCNMLRQTHYLSFLINLIFCLYSGATLSAIFVYSVMWGVLYALFVTIEWLFVMCLSCFVCICEKPYCRNFCESVRDLKQLAFVLIAGVLYKIIALFVILKTLTALI